MVIEYEIGKPTTHRLNEQMMLERKTNQKHLLISGLLLSKGYQFKLCAPEKGNDHLYLNSVRILEIIVLALQDTTKKSKCGNGVYKLDNLPHTG